MGRMGGLGCLGDLGGGFKHLVVVYAEQALAAAAAQKQQQLLTLVAYRDDMHLVDVLLAKVADGLAPVEHRREFQEHLSGL